MSDGQTETHKARSGDVRWVMGDQCTYSMLTLAHEIKKDARDKGVMSCHVERYRDT